MQNSTTRTMRRPLQGEIGTWSSQVPSVIQRLYAARGVLNEDDARLRLEMLFPASQLMGITKAVNLLIDAIAQDKHITVAGDYDCDGATGSAVAVRGLRMMGAHHVRFIVPDRVKHGYGLTPGLIDAMDPLTEVIVTVDSGVSSIDGVAYAKAKGMTVVVTDHHLPGDKLPQADAIVNPNLEGDEFPSKALAGVGVMFYLLLALRTRARDMGWWPARHLEPQLRDLLPIVAVGTIADLVPLDRNNRILVNAGLRMMREGQLPAGLKALVEVSRKDLTRLVAQDIGFAVAPRLNAAGRLENMCLGVETLLCDRYDDALKMVEQLDAINVERKELQAAMTAEAETMVEAMAVKDERLGITVFDPSWHAGVVGLVASKLKESLHRPVIALAPAEEGSTELRGSGRSIPGFHLRDALADIAAAYPGLIQKFGGHAMAAGLTIHRKDVETFAKAFDAYVTSTVEEEHLQAIIYSDGELAPEELSLEIADRLRLEGPWGQGFPEPVFDNEFDILAYQVIGQGHLKLLLGDPRTGRQHEGIHFFGYTGSDLPVKSRITYQLDVHVWNGNESLQLLIRHIEL